jgi:hypothetical protein
MHVESKEAVLLASLRRFYEDPANLRCLTGVLHGRDTKISLRALDWLVTNYAKKYNSTYIVDVHGDGRQKTFNIFLEYKSALRAYSKKLLDPFCRRERILFTDADGVHFSTTIAQLNFFRWCMKFRVLDYAVEHAKQIEDDMFASIQSRTSVKLGDAEKPKRHELSKAAICGHTNTTLKVRVTFA